MAADRKREHCRDEFAGPAFEQRAQREKRSERHRQGR
jgi:hypothetical protein